MTNYNNPYSAASLYEGGWRSSDKEEITKEYGLTREEADELVAELKAIEENQ